MVRGREDWERGLRSQGIVVPRGETLSSTIPDFNNPVFFTSIFKPLVFHDPRLFNDIISHLLFHSSFLPLPLPLASRIQFSITSNQSPSCPALYASSSVNKASISGPDILTFFLHSCSWLLLMLCFALKHYLTQVKPILPSPLPSHSSSDSISLLATASSSLSIISRPSSDSIPHLLFHLLPSPS